MAFSIYAFQGCMDPVRSIMKTTSIILDYNIVCLNLRNYAFSHYNWMNYFSVIYYWSILVQGLIQFSIIFFWVILSHSTWFF